MLAELAVDQQMVQQGRVNQLFLGVNIVNVLFKSLVSKMIFFCYDYTHLTYVHKKDGAFPK